MKTIKEVIEVAINHVDVQIDMLFCEIHEDLETESGDITPSQQGRLDEIKEQLALLVAEQVHQNL
jgi:hypothetical protein